MLCIWMFCLPGVLDRPECSYLQATVSWIWMPRTDPRLLQEQQVLLPLSRLPPHFTVLGQGLSLILKLIVLARVADQWAFRIHLSPFLPLPQVRLYLIFHMGARDLNLGLYACKVSIWSTEPSPRADVRLHRFLFAWFCTKLSSRKKLT